MGGQREQISGRPEKALQAGARFADRHCRDHLGYCAGSRDSLIAVVIRNHLAARQ
jgi:hypothetical protein